ncbi:uncharacterized protein LOC142771357 [Rhipicephalus microplus]|uniref:uncharacterized protein LOC142771357 n=1 Tax=Rhipicephalus microplus TaxID=6941 RepID=UPI003F6D425E
MKVQISQRQVARTDMVAKGRIDRNASRDHGSVLALFQKLAQAVPNEHRFKKPTELEILQDVINYIIDLEMVLSTHLSSCPPSQFTFEMSPAPQTTGSLPPDSDAGIKTFPEKKMTHVDKVTYTMAGLTLEAAPSSASSPYF